MEEQKEKEQKSKLIAIRVPIKLYKDLMEHVGTKRGVKSRFILDAVREKLGVGAEGAVDEG